MIIFKHWLSYWLNRSAGCIAVLAFLATIAVAAPQEQKSGYRDTDQKELTDYLLSMDKIQKLGEVEKATNEIFDADFNVCDAWNDHGIGELLSIGASV